MSTTDPPAPPAPPSPPDAGLGDAGKKALDEERKARRDAEALVKTLTDKLKQVEDSDKSETQKLNDRLAAAELEITEAKSRAMRLEVANAKGLSAAQAKRLVGATQAELEADADELIATFAAKPAEGAGGAGAGGTPPTPTPPPTQQPAPQMRPGGGTPDPEPDISEIVKKIPRL